MLIHFYEINLIFLKFQWIVYYSTPTTPANLFFTFGSNASNLSANSPVFTSSNVNKSANNNTDNNNTSMATENVTCNSTSNPTNENLFIQMIEFPQTYAPKMSSNMEKRTIYFENRWIEVAVVHVNPNNLSFYPTPSANHNTSVVLNKADLAKQLFNHGYLNYSSVGEMVGISDKTGFQSNYKFV